MTDGASAMIIASADFAEQHGLPVRARFRYFAVAAEDPVIVLSAPVPVTYKLMKRSGLSAICATFAVDWASGTGEATGPYDRILIDARSAVLARPRTNCQPRRTKLLNPFRVICFRIQKNSQ